MGLGFIFHYVKMVLRTLFVITNNLYCIPTYAIWMLVLKPLTLWNEDLYWYIEGKFFKWLLAMVAAWGWTAGYRVVEIGDDVSNCFNQECLLIVNHQSTADVPLLMTSFQTKKNVIPNMMWLMDKMFKYTNFGLVSVLHGDFFIRSGKNIRSNELQNLRNHLLANYGRRRRKWLVLFPEGGFLRKRKEVSQRFAKKNNLPDLEHVTLPRLGAMHTIITALSPSILGVQNQNHSGTSDKKLEPLKWVIDITIAYPNGEPLGLPCIVTASQPPCTTTLYYRRYPIEEIPTDMTALTDWLYSRWFEKEQMLDEFYKTGKFPTHSSPHSRIIEIPQPILLNNRWLIVLHLFFITSTLFHYSVLKWIVAALIYRLPLSV